MKIRATTLQRYHSLLRDELLVTTRLELQWRDEESWHNFGTNTYGVFEWDLILILMIAGANRMDVDFEQVDLTAVKMEDVHV